METADLTPVAALMRVWSEELWGKRFSKAYDFGPVGNQMYIGSLFSGPAGSVATFMSAGGVDDKIDLTVTSGDKLHFVDSVGVERRHRR